MKKSIDILFFFWNIFGNIWIPPNFWFIKLKFLNLHNRDRISICFNSTAAKSPLHQKLPSSDEHQWQLNLVTCSEFFFWCLEVPENDPAFSLLWAPKEFRICLVQNANPVGPSISKQQKSKMSKISLDIPDVTSNRFQRLGNWLTWTISAWNPSILVEFQHRCWAQKIGFRTCGDIHPWGVAHFWVSILRRSFFVFVFAKGETPPSPEGILNRPKCPSQMPVLFSDDLSGHFFYLHTVDVIHHLALWCASDAAFPCAETLSLSPTSTVSLVESRSTSMTLHPIAPSRCVIWKHKARCGIKKEFIVQLLFFIRTQTFCSKVRDFKANLPP